MRSEAYREGYRAYSDGLAASDNPYNADLPEWEEWKEGYHDAGWDD